MLSGGFLPTGDSYRFAVWWLLVHGSVRKLLSFENQQVLCGD